MPNQPDSQTTTGRALAKPPFVPFEQQSLAELRAELGHWKRARHTPGAAPIADRYIRVCEG